MALLHAPLDACYRGGIDFDIGLGMPGKRHQ
jgi:hypothetical protein